MSSRQLPTGECWLAQNGSPDEAYEKKNFINEMSLFCATQILKKKKVLNRIIVIYY